MGHPSARNGLNCARSVRDDWRAWLPAEKEGLFESGVEELETFYKMLSVTLDEAITLCHTGSLAHAREQVAVSADLFDRLAARIVAAHYAMERHGRHFGTLPNVLALNPEFFRGETAQRLAKRNSILSRVLFSSRSRFFHKLRAIADIVEDIAKQFRETAADIADGASVSPAIQWSQLDTLHYDLNTCLRETIVILKSFLCALPNDQVQSFQKKLQASWQLPKSSGVRVPEGSS